MKVVYSLSCLIILLTAGCGLQNQNQVNELDLLLEAEKMPIGWSEYYRNNDMIDSEYQKKEASAGYSKSDKDWIARSTEKVFLYGNNRIAERAFNRMVNYDTRITIDHYNSEIIKPNSIDWNRINAEDHVINCSFFLTNNYSCTYFGVYKAYVIRFGAVMIVHGKEFMSEDEFINTVYEIDKKVTEVLDSD